MKIQILADDGTVLDTIDHVQNYLMSQHTMGALLDDLLEIYKTKYSAYMYEKYKKDRRSGDDRRQHLPERRSSDRRHET